MAWHSTSHWQTFNVLGRLQWLAWWKSSPTQSVQDWSHVAGLEVLHRQSNSSQHIGPVNVDTSYWFWQILAVVADSRLSMADHVSSLCRSVYYQLRQLDIRFITEDAAKMVVQAFISSMLDYCVELQVTYCRNSSWCRMLLLDWSREPEDWSTSHQLSGSCTGYRSISALTLS